MDVGEQRQSTQVPVGLAGADGFPWSRLVLGVIAVLVSATTNWRAARQPVEPAAAAPPALQSAAATAALAVHPLPRQSRQPRPPEPRQRAPAMLLPAAPPLADPVQPVSAHAMKPPRSDGRSHLQRTAAHAMPRTGAPVRRKLAVTAGSTRDRARAGLAATRAALRSEYIARREQVAALTGEDSGSAYLSRLGARQDPAATAQPVRVRGIHQARHAASTRS